MKRIDLASSPAWKRFQHLLSGGVRQRITRLGYVYSFVIVVVGLAAFLSANNLLFLILALLLSVLVVSGFVSRMGLAGLELELTLPEHLTARQPARARVKVHNAKPWMPSFSIRLRSAGTTTFPVDLYLPLIPSGGEVAETVAVSFPRRGSYRENSFQFETRFPFGFTSRRIGVVLRGEVVVYPPVAPVPVFEDILRGVEGVLATRRRGLGSDFHRIRPYEPGESARHVDWKATAHTGQLQVREYASQDDRSVEIFLDLLRRGRVGDGLFEAWFEQAVECAAFLVWRLSEQGLSVRFRTQTASFAMPEEADAYSILRYLALVEPLSPASHREKFSPDDESHVHVALTREIEDFTHRGWHCPALGADGAGPGTEDRARP